MRYLAVLLILSFLAINAFATEPTSPYESLYYYSIDLKIPSNLDKSLECRNLKLSYPQFNNLNNFTKENNCTVQHQTKYEFRVRCEKISADFIISDKKECNEVFASYKKYAVSTDFKKELQNAPNAKWFSFTTTSNSEYSDCIETSYDPNQIEVT